MHQPGIVSLHSQTSANALHYAYRTSGDEQTQQLALLQCAAFVAMFREMTNTGATDFNLQKLQPIQPPAPQPPQPQPQPQSESGPQGTAAPPLEEIFADLSARRREQAAQKSLSYLRGGGDPGSLIAAARHHLV